MFVVLSDDGRKEAYRISTIDHFIELKQRTKIRFMDGFEMLCDQSFDEVMERIKEALNDPKK